MVTREVRRTPRFDKQLNKLPEYIRKKFKKQLAFLREDFYHPSLHLKKKGDSGLWEARVDYHYRFVFLVEENVLAMVGVGMHDEGLGKK